MECSKQFDCWPVTKVACLTASGSRQTGIGERSESCQSKELHPKAQHLSLLDGKANIKVCYQLRHIILTFLTEHSNF
jgi:hypothetical protein